VIEEGKKYYAIAKSIEYADCPPVRKIVRGDILVGAFVVNVLESGELEVTYIVNVDLGGSLPSFAVNHV
jgi:hypothetical protein